jgi:hypothetical protein
VAVGSKSRTLFVPLAEPGALAGINGGRVLGNRAIQEPRARAPARLTVSGGPAGPRGAAVRCDFCTTSAQPYPGAGDSGRIVIEMLVHTNYRLTANRDEHLPDRLHVEATQRMDLLNAPNVGNIRLPYWSGPATRWLTVWPSPRVGSTRRLRWAPSICRQPIGLDAHHPSR